MLMASRWLEPRIVIVSSRLAGSTSAHLVLHLQLGSASEKPAPPTCMQICEDFKVDGLRTGSSELSVSASSASFCYSNSKPAGSVSGRCHLAPDIEVSWQHKGRTSTADGFCRAALLTPAAAADPTGFTLTSGAKALTVCAALPASAAVFSSTGGTDGATATAARTPVVFQHHLASRDCFTSLLRSD